MAMGNKHNHYSIIKFSLATKSVIKKTKDNHTPLFIVDVKASKHQVKQAIKKLYHIDVSKVKTPIKPDRENKAYVQLTPDYEAMFPRKLGSSKLSTVC
jgi:large subunit ribosomal protein L23Ae